MPKYRIEMNNDVVTLESILERGTIEKVIELAATYDDWEGIENATFPTRLAAFDAVHLIVNDIGWQHDLIFVIKDDEIIGFVFSKHWYPIGAGEAL